MTDISYLLRSIKPVFGARHCGIDLQENLEGCGVHLRSAWQANGGNSIHDGKNHENDDKVDEHGPVKFEDHCIKRTNDCGLQESYQCYIIQQRFSKATYLCQQMKNYRSIKLQEQITGAYLSKLQEQIKGEYLSPVRQSIP